MRKKPVLLTVTGVAMHRGEEDDAMRLTTVGTLSGSRNKWKLKYEERQSDSDEKHQITMTLDDGIVTMRRDGAYGTNMVFQKGRRYESSYRTPFGTFDMGIFPSRVDYYVNEGGQGEISLKYQLDIQGQFTSVHHLRIDFAANQHDAV
ncbi:MAG: DUF1934 domain-containing protein [Christensenellales bacterium]